MSFENLPMFEELPVYPEDLEKSKKKKDSVNCLQDILIELLDARGVQLSDVQKATKIPWGTLIDWYSGDNETQRTDENLLRLAQYFNVTIEYLCYGIGDDSAAYEKFDNNTKDY